MNRHHIALPSLPLLLLAICACSEGEGSTSPRPSTPSAPPAPPPELLRANLFQHMDDAELPSLPGASDDGATRTTTIDFDGATPDTLWFGRPDGRRMEWEDPVVGAAIEPDGGLTGAGLRLGPGVPEDFSRALLTVPVGGVARVRLTARVRIEGNPFVEDQSTREVVRIVEHDSELEDPGEFSRSTRRSSSTRRVSRRHDPSGWDVVEESFQTEPDTVALEIQLLHRSGESTEAITRFDDITVEVSLLSDADFYADLVGEYRPRDGRETVTPWRLRVSLRHAGGRHTETRDAILLPPPTKLSIPTRVPPAESEPRLRFHYGMTSEGARFPGDGARIEVSFQVEGADPIAIGTVEFDPKNERGQRSWLEATFDLAAVAGETGRFTFASSDVDGEADLDPVVLSTPRIEPAKEAAPGFNVLMIGVDTLRADRMSAFGFERPTTPNLEGLADAGVRFMQTRSQAPWTLPSFSSILTSLYPSAHGAGRGGHDEWTPIDPTTTALAEILARVGYETQGLVANGLISPHYGLDQGFESYRWAWGFESADKDAEDVAGFIQDHRTTPWLMFWHIMDPHLPYSTPPEYRESFTNSEYDGQFARGNRPSVPFQVLDPRPGRRWFAHEGPPPEPDLTEDDKEYIEGYYAAELAEMDAAVGVVLDALRESGQWERTIVAFVADHGEGLGDHNHYHHGYTLFDDQVHIPMLLRIPGRHEGLVVERPVASIDLAPTILGALGLEPPDAFQGVDRLAADAPSDDAYFIEYPTYDSSAQKAWVQGDFKYLHDPVFHTEALYHLRDDPGELNDVAAAHPEIVARARTAMDTFRWEQLQKGRFHLRVQARAGQRLELSIETEDLFDANFVCRPNIPEEHFAMDNARKHLTLDTELPGDQFELVFWCRGKALALTARLDGKPLRSGLRLVDGEALDDERAEIAIGAIPQHDRKDVGWPETGGAHLWLEGGFGPVRPVVSSPEEIEVLKQLGYAR